MHVELVAPENLGDALRDWEELQVAAPDLTPFNSAAWGRVWLEHWEAQVEPWVMRVRHQDRVAGIAPLALGRVRGIRVLSMIGKEPGDYWDIIAAPGDRAAVACAVGAELRRRTRAWDLGVVSCLAPDSGTLEGFAQAGVHIFRRPPVRSPGIRLPSSFEEYLKVLPRSRRGNLRRHLNRLDGGELMVREIREPDEVREAMRSWHELRIRQWRDTGRNLTPSHTEERFFQFMVQAAVALIEPGYTSLWEVSTEDRLAGMYLNFCDERSFYWYLGGYEPALGSLGIGKIVIGATIRASIEAGRQWFDFTRGEDAYKYWYGAQDRLLESVLLGHGGARSRLALTTARTVSGYRSRRSAA